MKKGILVIGCFIFFLRLFLRAEYPPYQSTSIQLLNEQLTFTAGDSIMLTFTNIPETATTQLFLSNALHKIVLEPNSKNKNFKFKIPSFFAEKTGFIDWFLIDDNAQILQKGKFQIVPTILTKENLETYLGPQTMIAGKQNFSGLVAIPTDIYSNPLKDSTPVVIKTYYPNKPDSFLIHTQHLIAWTKIYSQAKTGKIYVAAHCQKASSKEFSAEILPYLPADFSIAYSSHHRYADGNELLSLESGIIKDKFGNIVVNGTLVEFLIQTDSNIILKTFGTTNHGIAKAQILHPSKKSTYTIQGFIKNFASSNTLTIEFQPVIEKVAYQFSKDNRQLTIGPIVSFLKQKIPDGIKVVIRSYQDKNQTATTMEKQVKDGVVSFEITPEDFKDNRYTFEITGWSIPETLIQKNYGLDK